MPRHASRPAVSRAPESHDPAVARLPASGTPADAVRRRLLVAAAAAAALPATARHAHAQQDSATPSTSEPFVPRVGQAGKDVVWVPTPDALVARMLRMAEVTPRDYVVDLGCGDGKIVIAAARDFGARALGVEFNPDMVRLARANAQRAGVAERARIEQGDIFTFDYGTPTVVTMYLLPNLNLRLRPQLMKLPPGTRLTSHQFTMAEWEPDEESVIENRSAYLWIVPANAAGSWQLRWRDAAGQGGTEVQFEQTFQKVKGTARSGDNRSQLRDVRVEGDRIRFELMDERGLLRLFEGRIEGNAMRGNTTARSVVPDRGPKGSGTFTATRSGEAPPIAS